MAKAKKVEFSAVNMVEDLKGKVDRMRTDAEEMDGGKKVSAMRLRKALKVIKDDAHAYRKALVAKRAEM